MHKKIGIIGGMSWESTLMYYQQINQGVSAAKGGLHSANLLLHSVDFQPISKLQHQGDWHSLGEQLATIAVELQTAGVQAIVLATNTMHKVAEQIENAVDVTFLHIVDALAQECRAKNICKVGLLGTRFTMEDGFYHQRLAAFGIDVVTPEQAGREKVHDIIYNELCQGVVCPNSRKEYQHQIELLAQNGAHAVVLGCTEIGLLISQQDSVLPVLDTTSIHTNAIVATILNNTSPHR